MIAFALAAVLLAAGPAPGDAAPALSIKDIKDRAVAVPDPGVVTVLSFASRSTGETAGAITRALRVAHPEVTIASIVDLSGFPGLLHGMIRRKILARHDPAVAEAREAFVKAGKTPPDDLDARIHIVPDFDGSSCKAYGASATGKQAEIAVIGPDGKLRAFFATTPTVEEVQAAVEKALPGK